MPAVTVEDITTVARIDAVPVNARPRAVKSITTSPRGFEGEGFPVRRAFAGVSISDLDPFVHLDQMGEVEYAPGEPKGTPWHPHRGFETVTYMIDGIMDHGDSLGHKGSIANGDTQWMTAGAGILHIEAPPEHLVISGGLFHGLQLWVNLPAKDKMAQPRYQDLTAAETALGTPADGGALIRVVAGDVAGLAGPGATYTPINFAHVTASSGAQVDLPWRPDFNALIYVLSGSGTVGPKAQRIEAGQLAVFGPGDFVSFAGSTKADAQTPDFDVVVLGGQPIREPVAMYGPFVMNTKAELATAFEDYQAGRLGAEPVTLPHV